MVGQGIDVIVLDGANRFDPYMVSSFARKVSLLPENLLRRIQIARAFTCYQMATLVEEKLVSLLRREGSIAQRRKPWVILLGPMTTFLDEDVPDREVRPLFDRALRKVEEMAMEGIPFFLFQPLVFSEDRSGREMGRKPPFPKRGFKGFMDSRRAYLTRRLFQLSDTAWKICLDDEGPKMILEKSPLSSCSIATCSLPFDGEGCGWGRACLVPLNFILSCKGEEAYRKRELKKWEGQFFRLARFWNRKPRNGGSFGEG